MNFLKFNRIIIAKSQLGWMGQSVLLSHGFFIFILVLLIIFGIYNISECQEKSIDGILEKYLNAIDKNPYKEDYYLAAAEIYFGQGREEEAIEILRKGYNKVPHPLLISTKLYYYYTNKNNNSESLIFASRRLEELPYYKFLLGEDKFVERMKDCLIDVAICLKNLQQWEEAIQKYKEVLEYEPSYVGGIADIGYCFENLGHQQESIKMYEKAVELSKGNNVQIRRAVHAYFRLAEFYADKEETGKAIDLYKRALEVDPWRVEEKMEFAALLEQVGRFNESYILYANVYDQLSLENQNPTYNKAKEQLDKLSQYVSEDLKTDVNLSDVPLRNVNIYVLPIGEHDNEILSEITMKLQDTFRLKMILLKSIPRMLEAYYDVKGQYLTTILMEKIEKIYNSIDDDKKIGILAILNKDIAEKDVNFLYSNVRAPVGVMSYYRFTAEFNNEEYSRDVLISRIVTQALTCVGHLLRLPRCNNPICARIYVHSFDEFLARKPSLCRECKRLLRNFLLNYPVL